MNLGEIFTPELDEGIHDPHIFKAVFMAGPPGAGKNMIISALGLNAAGLKLQDIDHTLAYLNKSKKQTGRVPDDHSNQSYERSLNTTVRRQSTLQKEMLGLIINTTGRDATATQKLNNQLKKAGYDTFMVFVDVSEDVAASRISNREQYATDPKDRRPVDATYFKSAYRSTKDNRDFYALMFGNQFVLVDNSDNFGEIDAKGNIKSAEGKQRMSAIIQMASKKIARFLAQPLTDIAQSIVDSVKQSRATRY